ncbi:Uma2 family endonuclease [Amycolatopsis suaedae]|uniref:Uma2 family endonuclease n=1 Tax=Amycolatopsis suaedae TaxID=2510978 RepID=A0A4Q7JCX0_9PSEU|nr:Uma2 family endonuclease [Amycolatopsis suaedae]RZQ65751.1 Uma2 family endonuclease [Amycolatopsis suaedae]
MTPGLLTVDEYAALGALESGYTELVEGRLLLVPDDGRDHDSVTDTLAKTLERQLPDGVELLVRADLDLRLAAAGEPGYSRRPDLMLVRDAAGGLVRSGEVVVVIEVAAEGSRRTDYVAKRAEYADAGIPHYWIVDLDEPVSLTACHLAGEFGYQDSGAVTGTFTTADPISVSLDLDRLL